MTCTVILRKNVSSYIFVDDHYSLRVVAMHKSINLPYPPFIGLNIESENNEEYDFKVEHITFSIKRWAYICSQDNINQINQSTNCGIDDSVSKLKKYDWVVDRDSFTDLIVLEDLR